MTITVSLQNASKNTSIPSDSEFLQWTQLALDELSYGGEVTIRIVEQEESQALNSKYRHKDSPTNVLSFNSDACLVVDYGLLGDLVICADIVENEAKEQKKQCLHHWAHMTIHGCLHLIGYDHIEDEDAQAMENLEISILKKLNIDNPYL